MQFLISNPENENIPVEVNVVYPGSNTIKFSLYKFRRKYFYDKKKAKANDVFVLPNLYIEHLKVNNLRAVNQLYLVYTDLKVIIQMVNDVSELNKQLTEIANSILNIIKLEDVVMWLKINNFIPIPPTVVTTYIHEPDKQHTMEQTYVLNDYIELVALSIIFRFLLPLFGEYIIKVEPVIGKDRKELAALQLLESHPIMESHAFEKLTAYVNKTIQVNLDQNGLYQLITNNFISSEDIPQLILSIVVIKRLTFGELFFNEDEDGASLLTSIYQFVKDKVANTYSESDGVVKENGATESAELGKLSATELLKIKWAITPGLMEEYKVFLSDPYEIAKLLGTQNSYEGITKWISYGNRFGVSVIPDLCNVFVGNIISPIITPTALYYLDRQSIMNILGVGSMILYERGFKLFSLLTLSVTTPMIVGVFSSTDIDTKSQLRKDLIIELDNLFPIHSVSIDKRNYGKNSNPAIKTIEHITTNLLKNRWNSLIHASEEDFRDVQVLNYETSEITYSTNLANLIAEFIINTQEHNRRIRNNARK